MTPTKSHSVYTFSIKWALFLSLATVSLFGCGPDKCPANANPKICVLLNEGGKDVCECTLRGRVCVADMKFCAD